MDDAPLAGAARPCPICGKPHQAKYRPFCSERCALVDLGRWLGVRYRVPSNERPEDPPGEAPEPPSDGEE